MSSAKTLGEAFDMVPPVTVNGEQVPLLGGALPAELQPHRGKAATPKSRDDWQTPPEFLCGLRQRWRFVLDAACELHNAVADLGLAAPQRDALGVDWLCCNGVETGRTPPPSMPGARKAVWCYPPYGRRGALARSFVGKAAMEAQGACGRRYDVVLLMAATPDVSWFHDAVLSPHIGCDEVWFTKGRLAFVHPDTGEPARNNGGGSVLLVWRAGWTPRTGAPFLGSISKDGTPSGAGGW